MKRIEDMTSTELRSNGQITRQQGTELMKQSDFESAADAFRAAVESFSTLKSAMVTGSPDPSALEEVSGALRSCLLNYSQCCLKLKRWELVVSSCSKVLQHEPHHIKALFRRGSALTALEQFEEAITDLKAAFKLEPKSREIREAYEKARAAYNAHRQAERSAFGGIFS